MDLIVKCKIIKLLGKHGIKSIFLDLTPEAWFKKRKINKLYPIKI